MVFGMFVILIMCIFEDYLAVGEIVNKSKGIETDGREGTTDWSRIFLTLAIS